MYKELGKVAKAIHAAKSKSNIKNYLPNIVIVNPIIYTSILNEIEESGTSYNMFRDGQLYLLNVKIIRSPDVETFLIF